ncbi:4129_t:CDS:2 [Paraglomus occultum]|uniref:4129_t:CDS:1 n=1 Tax=Paraglomus occultum TaxID=144539 RepID=A0A9N9BW17_9GLOM|nr:4129_t:CDS:2 [Paraglomus occultum]
MSSAQDEDATLALSSVSGILLNVLIPLQSNAIDPVDVDSPEDSEFEKSLCAVWDLSSIHDYARIFINEAQVHRMVLKAISITRRVRTEELVMGILANVACFMDTATVIVNDEDVTTVLGRIITGSADGRVLVESLRLLRNLLTNCSNNYKIIVGDISSYSIINQILFFVYNTMNTELLSSAIETMKLLISTQPELFINKQEELNNLFRWICDRLDSFEFTKETSSTIISFLIELVDTNVIEHTKDDMSKIFKYYEQALHEFSDDEEITNMVYKLRSMTLDSSEELTFKPDAVFPQSED